MSRQQESHSLDHHALVPEGHAVSQARLVPLVDEAALVFFLHELALRFPQGSSHEGFLFRVFELVDQAAVSRGVEDDQVGAAVAALGLGEDVVSHAGNRNVPVAAAWARPHEGGLSYSVSRACLT